MVEDNRAAVSLAQSGNKLDDMVKQADESFESELEAWLQEEAKQASAEKPAEPVNKKPFIPAESYGERVPAFFRSGRKVMYCEAVTGSGSGK